MKNKSKPILSSLVVCTLAGAGSPALADKQAIESAEASVKTFESRVGTNNPSYTSQLMYLAGIYQANGRRKEADVTFNKAIHCAKTRTGGESEIPGLMLSWAMTLASHHSTIDISSRATKEEKDKALAAEHKIYITEDLKKADNILLDGIALANALPATSKERINFMLGTISYYKMLGRKEQKNERVKILDEHLLALEKNPKLENADITQVAYSLTQLAGLFCTAPPARALRMLPPVKVVSDDSPDSSNTVKLKDFKIAEAYQLRAIAQYDRLPETVPWRIEAHRTLVLWYRHFGQTKQEEFQTQQLSKLMRTTDKNKLFPQPPPCPACGMG
jgi:hypothetical protein